MCVYGWVCRAVAAFAESARGAPYTAATLADNGCPPSNPHNLKPQDLSEPRCRAVAGAALAVSALLNSPPGFLEFLLCIPWARLPELYPAGPGAAPEELLAQLEVGGGGVGCGVWRGVWIAAAVARGGVGRWWVVLAAPEELLAQLEVGVLLVGDCC